MSHSADSALNPLHVSGRAGERASGPEAASTWYCPGRLPQLEEQVRRSLSRSWLQAAIRKS